MEKVEFKPVRKVSEKIIPFESSTLLGTLVLFYVP